MSSVTSMTSSQIHFGDFVLDPGRYELTRKGQSIRLERIPLELLILLASQAGRLVLREEIINKLWGKDVFVDTTNSINTAIRKIRRALGEDPEHPQYIETVPGKGYRFKVGSALIQAPKRPDRVMLAILPFENLSGDPAQEYFSDGLTEETIMRLGQISPERLGVIARTSAMVYKRTEKTVAQIGRELGVDYVLEGSVRRDGGRVRVTAQLIRVSDQIHLWADNFDRDLSSVLGIQTEIGFAIAEQVQLKLTPLERRRLELNPNSANVSAYDAYFRAKFHYARVRYPELLKAIEAYEQAIRQDENFASALAGLADTYNTLPITSDIPSQEAFPKAKEAISRALQLEPQSAEAHTSDGVAKFWYDWDWAGAELAFRRAISLNASTARAFMMLAHTLSNTGRHKEAIEIIQQARLLDPLSLIANTLHGQFLYHAGQDADSIRQLQATLELEPRFWVAHICLAKTYERVGRYDRALAACEKAWEFSGGNSEALSLATYIHASSGDHSAAVTKFDHMIALQRQRYVPPYNLALAMVGLGDFDQAIALLEDAYRDRDVHMTFLRDPKWRKLDNQPAFRTLYLHMKFPE